MITVGICGISGRMGKAVLRILRDKNYELGAAFEAESSPCIGRDAGFLINLDTLNVKINLINENDISEVDGIIDFSAPSATLALLDIAKKLKKPLVIGTTGFTEDEKKRIEETSKEIPLLFSPNMSIGVNLLFKLTQMASKALTGNFDIEIFEAHHRFKKDAPSGTAKKMLEIVKDSNLELNDASEVHDRSRGIGERKDDEIGMMVMRGGDTVGEHTIFYIGMGERIEITHRAFNRETFAGGAVLGMEYLIGKSPGSYNMFDVLGI